MTHTNNKDIRVLALKNGEYKPGIYTGYSCITCRHHVSFFNGDTGTYISLDSILFDETADGYAPDRALCLNKTN